MNKSKKYIYISIVIIQLLFLIFMAYSKQIQIDNGKKIILKVKPVDPRSVMRGSYVNLSYDISEIIINTDKNIRRGDTVYVLLKKDDKYWVYKDYSFERPDSEELFFKGYIRYSYKNKDNKSFVIRVEYGIEDYFVAEDKAQEYEDNREKELLYAQISVDKNGEAIVYGLSEE